MTKYNNISGHGLTTGDRVQSLVSYEEDYAFPVLEHCHKMKALFPGKKLFILGHSMGGLITVLALLKEQQIFAGVVLMGPLIEVSF